MENARMVAALNDALRRSFRGGKVVMTAGVQALPEHVIAQALAAMRAFTAFNQNNDPRGEHDFSTFEVGDHALFFKIDYYDRGMEFGSPDPADPAVTIRVLTLMLTSEQQAQTPQSREAFFFGAPNHQGVNVYTVSIDTPCAVRRKSRPGEGG